MKTLANKHVRDVYFVLKDHVGLKHLKGMLDDLTKTGAYKNDTGFQGTIDKLITEYESETEG